MVISSDCLVSGIDGHCDCDSSIGISESVFVSNTART